MKQPANSSLRAKPIGLRRKVASRRIESVLPFSWKPMLEIERGPIDFWYAANEGLEVLSSSAGGSSGVS